MKKLSMDKLVNTVINERKAKGLTQVQLAEATGINRAMIGRLENSDYIPSIDQLQRLGENLGFEVTDLFVEEEETPKDMVLDKKYRIAVAGTGYVGLSIATLLAQHNHVTAVDIIPEKVELINNKKSPIQDEYIQSQSHSAVQSGAEYFAYIHQSILLFLLYRVTSALKTLDIPFRHPPYSYSFPRTTKTVLNIVAISLKNENFLMFSRLYFILPGRTSSI